MLPHFLYGRPTGREMSAKDERGTLAMVITEVEANVAEGHWELMRRSYRQLAAKLEPQIVRSYLLQGTSDPTLWRVMTVWVSQEGLEEYRRSVDTPGALVLFRSVGAEPTRSIFNVVESASSDGA